MSRIDTVRAYYAQMGEGEWLRLTRAEDGAIEHELTLRALARHLPKGGRVLDLGGGPGRYTIWLARHGHRVVLADLSEELLEIARGKIDEEGVSEMIEDVVLADATVHGPWERASFDAALCLGPFYHLPDPTDRDRAASELTRLIRPGGIVFVAFVPRYTLLRRTLLLPDESHRLSDHQWVKHLLHDGLFENDVTGRFSHAYGARPEEIVPFFERHGFEKLALISTEGIATGMDVQRAAARLAADDPAGYQAWLDIVEKTSEDPGILSLAGHLLYVGRRR